MAWVSGLEGASAQDRGLDSACVSPVITPDEEGDGGREEGMEGGREREGEREREREGGREREAGRGHTEASLEGIPCADILCLYMQVENGLKWMRYTVSAQHHIWAGVQG